MDAFRQWKIELENSKEWKRNPSLLKTIFRTFLWEYFLLGMIQILNEFVIRYYRLDNRF